MNGYTKLFGSIVASSIWQEEDATRLVWITMLALANKDGIVLGSALGLANIAKVSIDKCRIALIKLESPDPDSSSKEHEGRRIKVVDGGWLLLNHAKYRAKLSADERREYFRINKAENRAKSTNVQQCPSPSNAVPLVTHTEAEADTEAGAGDMPTSVRISMEGELNRVTKELDKCGSLSDYTKATPKYNRVLELKNRQKELRKTLGVVA